MTIPSFAFACLTIYSLIYWAMRFNDLFFIGMLGFIDCLFIIVTLTSFTKKYAFTLFDYNDVNVTFGTDKYENKTHTEAYLVLNEDNSVSIKEKRVGSGGDAHLFAILFVGLFSLLFGIVRFIIEAIRVLTNNERKIEWEIQRHYLVNDIKKDGIFFWLGMIIMVAVFALLWLITILI